MQNTLEKINLREQLKNTKKYIIPMQELVIISRNEIMIEKKPITITDQAFKDLVALAGLTNHLVNYLNGVVENAGFNFLKQLTTTIAAQKNENICLLISEADYEVKRICLEKDLLAQKGINPEVFEDLIAAAIKKSNGKVQLANAYALDGGTKYALNLKWDNIFPLTTKGEDVFLGKQIVWDLLGPTTFADYIERVICTNGMTAVIPNQNIKYLSGDSNSDSWYKTLFHDILNPDHEKVKHYERKVFEAAQTNLSVAEYNDVRERLSAWKDDDAIITKYLGDERWKEEYIVRDLNLDNISRKQLANCPTPINAWDAINCITDLASHIYTANVPDSIRKNTQQFAGKLLNKSWDENQQIFNLPTFGRTSPSQAFSFN